MALVQTVAPTIEPVTLDELKHHLRLSTATTVEDVLLNSYITVARRQSENMMRRQINDASWQLLLPSFPSVSAGAIDLPRPPLTTDASEISIGYIDSSYSTQTVPTTAYTIDHKATLPRIYPSANTSNVNSWTDFNVAEVPNAVTITYVSGYSSSTGDNGNVPDEIKLWIKMRVGQMYEYREPMTTDQYRQVPRTHFNGLLDAYTIEGEAT